LNIHLTYVAFEHRFEYCGAERSFFLVRIVPFASVASRVTDVFGES
jgi:hypothetical protein